MDVNYKKKLDVVEFALRLLERPLRFFCYRRLLARVESSYTLWQWKQY